jgi:hypothetical protein
MSNMKVDFEMYRSRILGQFGIKLKWFGVDVGGHGTLIHVDGYDTPDPCDYLAPRHFNVDVTLIVLPDPATVTVDHYNDTIDVRAAVDIVCNDDSSESARLPAHTFLKQRRERLLADTEQVWEEHKTALLAHLEAASAYPSVKPSEAKKTQVYTFSVLQGLPGLYTLSCLRRDARIDPYRAPARAILDHLLKDVKQVPIPSPLFHGSDGFRGSTIESNAKHAALFMATDEEDTRQYAGHKGYTYRFEAIEGATLPHVSRSELWAIGKVVRSYAQRGTASVFTWLGLPGLFFTEAFEQLFVTQEYLMAHIAPGKLIKGTPPPPRMTKKQRKSKRKRKRAAMEARKRVHIATGDTAGTAIVID